MNATVNASQGLKKFFFYLSISACVGLFSNHFIQKKLQTAWGPVALQLASSGLDVSAPRMVYSRMGVPVFGAQIDRLRYEKNWRCFDGLVTVKDVFVPFSVYRLLSKKVKFGDVNVGSLHVELIESPVCDKKLGPLDIDAPPKQVDVLQELEQEAQKELASKTPEWFALLDRWYVEREKILAKNPLTSLVINSLSIDARTIEDKALSAQGHAKFSLKDDFKSLIVLKPLGLRKREKSLTTEFKSEISATENNVQVTADWGFHEGHFTVDLNYDNQKTAKFHLKSRDLPVSVLNKWLDTDWSFQFLWFNCDVSLTTEKKKWSTALWSMQNCRMDGPNGNIRLTDTETPSLKKPGALQLKISNLDLDKIIHGRDSFVLSNIFKAYGQLEGNIALENENWTTKLTLKKPQVVFSSDNKRRLQVVEKMDISGSYDSGEYALKINSAEIQNGDFKGFISMDYNDRAGKGRGKIDVDQLSFDSEIEDLMFAGQVSPLRALGEFEIDKKWELTKALGQVDFRSFGGRHVELNSVSLLASWEPELMKVTGTAAQVKVLPGGKGQWVMSSLLQRKPAAELNLYQVYTQGYYSNDMFQLEKLVASGGSLRLELNGTYSKANTQGAFTWQEKSALLQSWKWFVRHKEIAIVPNSEKTLEWLQIHPEYLKENPSIFRTEKEL